MNNFKSGSGNLNFGDNDEDDEEAETTTESSQTQNGITETAESTSVEETRSASDRSSEAENTSKQPASDESSVPDSSAEKYPYFVRRSNVGDERDTRLEIHVRDKVADQEAAFRNELAEQLETNEVSKTDAREFALLAAFQNPERVAELMQDEGFGTLG